MTEITRKSPFGPENWRMSFDDMYSIDELNFNLVYATLYGVGTAGEVSLHMLDEAFINELRRVNLDLAFTSHAQIESDLRARGSLSVNVDIKPGNVWGRRISGCQGPLAAANATMDGVYTTLNGVFNNISNMSLISPEEDKAGSPRKLNETHARVAVRVSQAVGESTAFRLGRGYLGEIIIAVAVNTSINEVVEEFEAACVAAFQVHTTASYSGTRDGKPVYSPFWHGGMPIHRRGSHVADLEDGTLLVSRLTFLSN